MRSLQVAAPLNVYAPWDRPSKDVFGSLIAIMNCLEPSHLRISVNQFHAVDFASYLSYMQSIITWKDTLQYFDPQLRYRIDLIESYFAETSERMLRSLDLQHSMSLIRAMAFNLSFAYNEICALSSWPTVHQLALQHLQSAIENRINTVYGILFSDAFSGNKSRQKDLRSYARFLASLPKVRRFLPIPYQRCRWSGDHFAEQAHQSPLCLLEGVESGNLRRTRIPSTGPSACLCSLVLRCIPRRFLAAFQYEPRTFSNALHDTTNPPTYILSTFPERVFEDTGSSCKQNDAAVIRAQAAVAILFRVYFDTLAEMEKTSSANTLTSSVKRIPDVRGSFGQIMAMILTAAMHVSQHSVFWQTDWARKFFFDFEMPRDVGELLLESEDNEEATRYIQASVQDLLRKMIRHTHME